MNFEVGDMVLVHLKKERFHKREYNKLKFKNIGAYKIVKKFLPNAYEIELLEGVGISLIFNVVDL